ncbi:cytochrome P450 81Q32-like [Rhodamnia argentea]|uniref:Cytochrome P450 81Q32-like n=1 Tax=Rhodamnia argentea TaxID=178133 RepID=A0A8B8PT97_9MYRT|nr:cytochrome P450 81Q32-like [Rhodamnia argentea]
MVIQFLLLLAFFAVAERFLHKIRNLPRPPFPTLPVVGHLYLLKKPLHRSLSRLSRRHGPVSLLHFGSRRVLVVSSPDAAEECLTKNDVVFANRPRLLAGKHLGYNYTSLAWSAYGDHWRNLRRIASLEILSTNRLLTLSGIRAGEVKSLIRQLAKSGGQSVDMKSAFFELMLNVMMQMIAGKRYYRENVGEVEEARQFREMVTESFRVGGASNIGEFLPFLRWMGLTGVEEKLMELQKKRDEFMQSLIDERRSGEGDQSLEAAAEGGKRKTLIQVLLSLQATEPDYYKDETIKSLMLVLLPAGTDTSAATTEWAMSAMLNHPEILKKAQAEIDEVVGHDRLVGESDLPKLPYLHCIMNETMRMYPVGPLLVPHESAEECRVGGYRVPRGTMLLINLFSIQNDPKYWPDATKFKPERFEGMEGVRDGYKMMPFGSGRRGCPGENLALRMVGLTLGSLIQCFEWNRISDEPIDMTEGTGLTMPKAQPLLAKCRPRSFTWDLLSQA